MLAVTVTVCLVSVIIAGFTSLILLADRIHPIAGTIVFWAVCLAAGFFALYLRLHMQGFLLRLSHRRNIPVRSTTPIWKLFVSDSPQIHGHVTCRSSRRRKSKRRLGICQSKRIQSSAGQRAQCFSYGPDAKRQTGRAHCPLYSVQMVGRIACIYVQRPSPRELIRLYANVAGTAFRRGRTQSLDLGEMVAPLAVSVVPALKGGIPGLSGISALLVKCVSNGAANAFLTLRVGEVARRLCELTSQCSPTYPEIGHS